MLQMMDMHRVNTTRHAVALVFISLLLLLTQITSVESFNFESKIHPTRWAMPSPLEIYGNLKTPRTSNSFSVTISFIDDSNQQEYIFYRLNRECYAVLDNSDTIQVRGELSEQQTRYILRVLFDGSKTFTEVYIRCQGFSILRPSHVKQTTEHTLASLFIYSTELNSNISTITIDIVQHPTVIHQYEWSHDYGAMVTVTFSFYRPSAMADVSELYLDHPLLQVKRITSTHLAPETSYIEDLRRPYNLLLRDDYAEGIICFSIGYPALPSQILFQRDPVSDEVIPLVRLPTAADGDLLDQPYTCSFAIDYPPDVIYASMYSMESVNEELKVTIRRRSDGVSFTNIPLGVPLMIPSASTSTLPPGVLVWYSPHQTHEDMMEFEIAIATTSLYFESAAPNKLQIISNPQTDLILQITSSVGDSYLQDWDAGIVCHQHNSHAEDINSYHNGIFNLRHRSFKGLGQTCRVILQKRPAHYPSDIHYSIAIQALLLPDGVSTSKIITPTIFDGFHRFRQAVSEIVLHDTGTILPQQVPAIRLTMYEDDDNGKTYIRATMNLQYMISHPTTMAGPTFHLHLAFNKRSELLKVVNGNDNTTAKLIIRSASSSHSILDADIDLPSSHVNFWNTLPEDPPYINIFHTVLSLQPSGPVRAPRLILSDFPETLVLDSTRPLHITLEWEPPVTTTANDIENIVIYPFLLSEADTLTSAFSPVYSRITPVRSTPLTGYSYRCVTWNRMAAPYVYQHTEFLTMGNSFACPSYTQGDTLDLTHWRRIVYQTENLGSVCFYELAALCVTPSATIEGGFKVHPLADCSSFLGAVHAIPCSLVDDDVPEWNYSMTDLTATLSPPVQGDEFIHTKRALTLWWTYRGDTRRTLTATIKPIHEPNENGSDGDNDGNNSHTSGGWITLARDIPAHLSPKLGEQGLVIKFPLLSPHVKLVEIRLILNGAPGTDAMTTIEHTMAEDPWEGHQKACDSRLGKVFDDLTHLCKCADGLIASGPTSVDNPLVYPLDFSCEEKPQEQVPINPEQCHTIPEGVTPPYFTQDCGYGFAVSTNGKCDECTCFNAWKKGSNDDEDNNNNDNEGKKCERCRLKDVCIPQHTADITFEPEYCLVGRCLCEPGYSGDRCQYAVMYGTLSYHDVATDEQKANPALINATKESPVIIPRRQITTFQPRVANNVKMSLGDTPVEAFVQQATQVLSLDGEEVITSIIVALGRLSDEDPETSPSPSPPPFIMGVTSTSQFTPAAGDVNTTSNNLGDLHYAWEQLQNNYKDRPVYKDDDYGTLNGGVGSANDPHCVPNVYTYCPDGKEDDLLPPASQVDEDELKDVYEEEDPDNPIIDISDDDGDNNSGSNTTTYIIIGVVVGVVLLLFVLLIVAILYCRKHSKMCFRKRRGKGDAASGGSRSVELASSNTATSPSAAAPPPSTMSTSSYLPTQVQVEDPTLPADWVALEDKSTGKVYYSNKVTMESSWDHPAQPKEKAAGNAYGW